RTDAAPVVVAPRNPPPARPTDHGRPGGGHGDLRVALPRVATARPRDLLARRLRGSAPGARAHRLPDAAPARGWNHRRRPPAPRPALPRPDPLALCRRDRGGAGGGRAHRGGARPAGRRVAGGGRAPGPTPRGPGGRR